MAATALNTKSPSLRRAIIVCALGYFMDVFDYNLFTVLRVSSLADMGVPSEAQATVAGYILNAQLVGILIGAFLWGYLGDRYGRLKPLYSSIFIYSAATIACGFIHDPFVYGILRFFAGVGIAGEVGAATTLISELMHPKKRGWGIAIIAGLGTSAPIAAVLSAWFFDWRMIYIVAGLLGLALLVLRMRLVEPALFKKIAPGNHQGSLRLLLQSKQAIIFFSCIFICAVGTYANWFLNFFSLELSHSVLAPGEVFNQKSTLLSFYVGLGLGDAVVCVISQILQNRLKVLASFLFLGAATVAGYLMLAPVFKISAFTLESIYFVLGLGAGSWALLTITAAEHFGTNIRATSTTLISNLSRASTIPVLFAFQNLKTITSNTNAAALIGLTLYVLAFWGLSRLRETHGLDLDYVERLEKPRSKA